MHPVSTALSGGGKLDVSMLPPLQQAVHVGKFTVQSVTPFTHLEYPPLRAPYDRTLQSEPRHSPR